jgi:hypothetical protein
LRLLRGRDFAAAETGFARFRERGLDVRADPLAHRAPPLGETETPGALDGQGAVRFELHAAPGRLHPSRVALPEQRGLLVGGDDLGLADQPVDERRGRELGAQRTRGGERALAQRVDRHRTPGGSDLPAARRQPGERRRGE